MSVQYKLVVEPATKIEASINSLMKEGWNLFGNPLSLTKDRVAQGMLFDPAISPGAGVKSSTDNFVTADDTAQAEEEPEGEIEIIDSDDDGEPAATEETAEAPDATAATAPAKSVSVTPETIQQFQAVYQSYLDKGNTPEVAYDKLADAIQQKDPVKWGDRDKVDTFLESCRITSQGIA